MAANNDFFVRFDSNAKGFASKLNRELGEARTEIESFKTLLASLDEQGERTITRLHRGLSAVNKAAADGGGKPAQSPAVDPSAVLDTNDLMRDLGKVSNEIRGITSQMANLIHYMGKAVPGAENFVKGQNYSAGQKGRQQRGLGNWQDPITGRMLSNAVGPTVPGAYRMGDPGLTLARAIETASSRTPVAPQLAPVSVSALSKMQIDEGGFDRVVKAIDRVETAIRNLKIKGVRGGRASDETPAQAAKAVRDKVAPPSGGGASTPATSELTDQEQQIRAEIIAAKKDVSEIFQLMEQVGIELTDQMKEKVQNTQKHIGELEHELAEIERQRTGESKSERKARRKSEFAADRAKNPDLPEEEWQRRKDALARLNAPANEDLFRASVGRGKGQIGTEALRDIAQEFLNLGIELDGITTAAGSLKKRLTNKQLTEGILSGRRRYEEEYQGTIPEDLRTGRKIKGDKVSDNVRDLLGELNASGEYAERLEQARKVLSANAKSGGTFDDHRGRPIKAGGAILGEGHYAGGQVFRDPNEVVQRALDVFAQHRAGTSPTGLGRAAVLASSRPDFNPWDPQLMEEISGSGPEARNSRSALRQLRDSTEELDELGRHYQTFRVALEENQDFIERATRRLKKGTAKPNDAEKVEAAREQVGLLQNVMNSDRFRGLQDVFEDPSYIEGAYARRDARAQFEAQQEMRKAREEADAPEYLKRAAVRQSLGQAVVGSHLAFGVKDTYVQQIPGLTFRGDKFGLKDEADPRHAGLGELNTAYNRLVAADSARRQIAEGDKEGDLGEAVRHVETRAIRFLNQLDKLFGLAPTFESVVGRKIEGPTEGMSEDERKEREQALAGEARRNRHLELARAKANEKLKAQSPEEVLDTARAGLSKTEQALNTSQERLASVTERLSKAREVAARSEREMVEALDDDARAAYEAAEMRRQEILQQRDYFKSRQAPLSGEKPDWSKGDPETRGKSAAERRSHERFGYERDPETKAYLDPYKRDALGYDLVTGRKVPVQTADGSYGVKQVLRDEELGYGPSAMRAEQTAIDRELDELAIQLARANAEIAAALGRDNSEQDALLKEEMHLQQEVERLSQAMQKAAQRVAEYESELEGVSSKVPEKTEGGGSEAADVVATETQKSKKARSAADEKRIKQLKKEREELKKGPHTQADIDAAMEARKAAQRSYNAQKGVQTRFRKEGKDTVEVDGQVAVKKVALETRQEQEKTAREAKKRLGEIRRELKTLEGGGKGGSGGGNKGTAAAGAGGAGNFEQCCNRIVGKLESILQTLKTGIKVTGGTVKTVGGKGDEATFEGGEQPKRKTRSRIPEAERKAAEESGARRRQLAQEKRNVAIAQDEIRLAQEQERLDQMRVRRSRRVSEAKRAEAHVSLQVAAAQKLLSAEALRELSALKKLNAESDDAVAIANQQARAYEAVARSLAEQGVGAADQRRLQGILQGEALGRKVKSNEITEIRQTAAGKYGHAFDQVDSAMAGGVVPGGIFGEQSKFTQAMFGNHGFWSRIMSSTGTFVVRNFAAGFVFGMTNALQEVMRQAILTESTFVRVSDALEQTGRDTGALRTDLQSIAADYGVALNDVYETAAGLVGLFDTTEEIAGATRVVAQLQAISMGALTAQESMGALASITGAFRDELPEGTEGLEHVADVLTTIQNLLGTNVEITAEGVGALSGLAKQLKIDFEDASVYVAQIAKLTNQTGAAAGEQFGRILGSMQTGRARAALQEALPDSGIAALLGQGDYGQALRVLMQEWDGLSDSQQRNLTVTIAGQRQARAFAALMGNSNKVLNTAAKAHDAYGEAAERAANMAQTLNGLIARLGTNLQDLAQNLIRTGLLNFFGVLLSVTNGALSMVNTLFSEINDFADDNAFARWLKDIGFGILGLVATLTLATKAFHGFKATLNATLASQGAMGAGMRAAGAAGAPGLRETMGRAAWRLDEKSSYYRDKATRPGVVAWAGAEQAKYQKELAKTSRVYTGASRATAGLSRGVERLSRLSAGAGLGLLAVASGIAAIWGEMSEARDHAQEFRDRYEKMYGDAGVPKSREEREEVYVGPNREQAELRLKETEGFWNGVGGMFGQTWENIKNPWEATKRAQEDWGADDLLGLDGFHKERDRWRGIVSDQMQGELDDLRKSLARQTADIDPENAFAEVFPELKKRTEAPEATIKAAQNLQRRLNSEIAQARAKIMDGSGSDYQKQAALGQLEEINKENADRLASIILVSQGIAEADQLNSDQIKRIDQLRGMFKSTQGTMVRSGNKEFAQTLDSLINNTGTQEGSEMRERLERMAEGNLDAGQFLLEDQKALQEEIKNIAAKFQAVESGDKEMETEELDALEAELVQKMIELGATTEEIIRTFVDSSTTLAQQAALSGDYAGAAQAINAGLAVVASQRNRKTETPTMRAQLDLMETQQAEQAAEYAASEKNERLEISKARSQDGVRDASLEAQIAKNTLQALQEQQRIAADLGVQGPSLEALRRAKMTWIQSEQSLAQSAAGLNIARMTAAAAGIWNGIASAQAQEAIALVQLENAKETGDRIAIANARASYKNAKKSSAQTADQVAQAQRDAALAAIPQGNAVAVANAGVANAQAALAAAEKYGQNSVEYQGALAQLANAQQQAQAAQAAVTQAQASLAQAYADARGDGVASAQAAVGVAQAALSAALQASGGAMSADVMNAQAQLVAANAQVDRAQLDLVQSRVGISIAIAEAAGHTVRAAKLQLKSAQTALEAALRRSGGENTAEVNQARAQVIAAERAAKDAELQDKLDTIDFNLEMNRITQSQAISALREILRTADLTKQQRRDLLLRIRGMEKEMADSMWNFGDIKMPTPYQMRRYIKARKRAQGQVDDNVRRELQVAQRAATTSVSNQTTIYIDGADTAKVERIIDKYVGKATRVRTTGARRR